MGDFRRNKRTRKRTTTDASFNNKQMTIAITILIVVVLIAIIAYTIRDTSAKKEYMEKEELTMAQINETLFQVEEEITKEPDNTNRPSTINISIVGNIMCEDDILNDGKKTDGTYDFSHIFENIKVHLQSSDVAIGNLETNFVNEEYSGKTKYNSPKEFGQALKDIGIDVVSTANNHAFAYGKTGIEQTLDYLDEIEISHVGTNREGEDNILIKDVEGINIAFLAYTYGLSNMNGVSEDYTNYINITNKENILKDLEKLSEEDIDYICVNMHWGDGNSANITEDQKDLTNFLFENGVDLIIGSHPTYIQHIEVRQNSDEEDSFVAFSTGSFISTSGYKSNNVEMILNIRLTKDKEGKTHLTKVTYTPIHLLDNGRNAENRYELVDVKQRLTAMEISNQIDEALYKKLNQVLIDIEKQIGKEE